MKRIFLAILVVFVFGCETDNTNDNTVTDIDGNTYPTITIGSQVWMAKNLDVSRYRNGDPIPQVQDSVQWSNLTTGAWCYYANNTANGPIYGKLYNWYAVNDPRGLAPNGWHVPTNAEWTMLIDYLGGVDAAGDKMRSTGNQYWQNDNSDATNESGFSGLPGGSREANPFFDEANFSDKHHGASWYSTAVYNTNEAYFVQLSVGPDVNLYNEYKLCGFSVRCIKD
jgi:uncharacterized protein (TIGR02145 family)